MLEFVDIQAWVLHQIQNNDIFAGVVGGSVLLSSLYYLKSLPPLIGRFFRLQLSVHVVVHNSDEIFYHLESWFGNHPALRKTRRLRLTSKRADGPQHIDDGKKKKPEYNIGPGIGWHWFFYKRRLVIFRRDKEDQVNVQTMQVKESFDITIIGRKRAVFEEIVAAASAASKTDNGLKMHIWNSSYWAKLGDRQTRSIQTIILPDKQIERIVKDIDWFSANEKWFYDRGIPYHRGYLFSGPSGTGKTSMATALASYTKRDVYLVNLSSIEKDDTLIRAFSDVTRGALVLIEDIDTLPAIHQRTEIDEDGDVKRITLSGLLNAIDGVATPQDCIIVMTTNHPEKIDRAMMRKGRVDIDEEMLPLESYLVERMYEMFTGNKNNARTLAYCLRENIPAAELQGLLMEHGDNPVAMLKAAPEYFGSKVYDNTEVA